ncbi:hypothetical protein GCM10022408_37860 [Hymenobacter fastidiosus]|uniref:Uncharacterized protein n=1 Tax=Hymenobacter fastidiosus TaxID=486264 RepID=A0ABP7T3D0_9BACT
MSTHCLPEFTAALSELRVFDIEPDWANDRYRVYAARSEADCIRYGQGKRYDFCICRRHHNYYHDYRARYNSSYYFVYDSACAVFDKTHVTVVAVRPDGSCEFTYANNAEDYYTRQLGNSLDRFLATKPGLEQAKALFSCDPLTPAEVADVATVRAASAGTISFAALTPAQQLQFVQLGNTLTDAAYAQAPVAVREAYISRAHLLTDAQAASSTEPQRRRAAQLFRLYNVKEQHLSADWLTQYPPPSPASVAAHHTSQWPPSAADLAGWGWPATTPTVPPVMEDLKADVGLASAGPDDNRWLKRLHRAVAANPQVLFPVQELVENPTGVAAGPVIIARQDKGYVVLVGNAQVRQAKITGEVDIVVRLATRANVDCTQAGGTNLESIKKCGAIGFNHLLATLGSRNCRCRP